MENKQENLNNNGGVLAQKEIAEKTVDKKKLSVHAIVIICVVAALGVFFIIWTALTFTNRLYNFERNFYYFIVGNYYQRLESDFRIRVARLVSRGGNFLVLFVIYLLFILIPKTRHKIGLKLLAAGGLATLINQIVKTIIARPRPEFTYVAMQAFSASYPSGHSFNTMAWFTVLVWFIYTKLKDKAWIGLIAPALFVPAAMVMLSRVYLGVHYVTDIVAGGTLGVMLGLAGMKLWPIVWPKIGRWMSKFHKMRHVHAFLWEKEEISEI